MSVATSSISLRKQLSPRRVILDALFRTFLYFSIFSALGMIFWVVSRLWRDSGWFLSWDLITNFPSYDIDNAGFQSPLVGSIWVVGTASLMALPIGVMTALYLEEFAGKK
ncbi:MAG: phosphate transporter permease subunit PtsA, partial [Actinomycetota bacterium]